MRKRIKRLIAGILVVAILSTISVSIPVFADNSSASERAV